MRIDSLSPATYNLCVYAFVGLPILPLFLYAYAYVCLYKYCVIYELIQIRLMIFVHWLHGLRGYDWKICIFFLYLLNVNSPKKLGLYVCHLLKNIHLISFHCLVLWAKMTAYS